MILSHYYAYDTIKTGKGCTWNVTFQVFLKKLINEANLCCACTLVQNRLKVYVKCHFSSFSKKKLKNWKHLCSRKLKFAIWYIKTCWKFTWNVTFQVFVKKKLKIGNICCCKLNLQYGTSKLFESLREMSLFKFF